MIDWVLILAIVTGDGAAVAVTHVPGFATASECLAAASHFTQSGIFRSAACVKRTEPTQARS